MAVEKAPVPSIGWTAYTVDKFHLLTTMLAGPSDVLIKLNVTGLCLTDVHFMMNDWAFPKMSEMGLSCAGHEGAGVIVKIGERVKSCKVGQRAAYGPIHSTCSLCEYCKSGRETYCQQAVYTGGTVDGTLKNFASAWAGCVAHMLSSRRNLQAVLRRPRGLCPCALSDTILRS